MSLLLLAGGLSSGICVVTGLFLLRAVEAHGRLTMRIGLLQQSVGLVNKKVVSSTSRFTRSFSVLGTRLARSGALSEKTLAELQQTLALAGFQSGHVLGIYIGSKIALFITLPFISWLVANTLGFTSRLNIVAAVVVAISGLLAPDFVVKQIRAKYLARVEKGLPDALDMLVICSEAGLGLEPSISRVATEISYTHPAVSTELMQTASELRVLSDRRLALQNMGSRTGLEGLKRLGSTLVQTVHYGTPISQALRTLSAEMRTEVLTKFDERAARLPVLLTIPMIVFILPTVFIIVAGPAMLRVMTVLHIN